MTTLLIPAHLLASAAICAAVAVAIVASSRPSPLRVFIVAVLLTTTLFCLALALLPNSTLLISTP